MSLFWPGHNADISLRRIRRVKCDEGKPWCQRCTSTGRKCDGYTEIEALITRRDESPATTTASLTISPGALPEIPSGDEERRAFRYFADVGAFRMAAHTDVGFWSRLVPQRAHTEPAVRYASTAIGSLLLRADDISSNHGSSDDLRDVNDARLKFAIQHYNEAIKLLMRAIEQGRVDPGLAAITCVLFFCIEALQGREYEALSLFTKARRALEPQLPSSALGLLAADEEDLEAQFARMTIQCGMFQGAMPDEEMRQRRIGVCDPILIPAGQIQSIAQARNELSDLLSLVQDVVVLGWSPDSLAQLGLRRQSLDAALRHWHRRFDYFKSTSYACGTADPSDTMALSILMQHYLIAQIWLASCLGRCETVYDNYLATFEALIAEARLWLELMQRTGRTTSFAFEMGLIPPLYWTALKCRHPILRCQALSLRRAPAQEGLWSRDIYIRVAERVIQLEEGTYVFKDDTDVRVKGQRVV